MQTNEAPKVGSNLTNIKPKEVIPRKFEAFTILVYGPSGVGKTYFSTTAMEVPELRPVLFLNYEGGIKSVRSKLNIIELSDLGKVEPSIDKVDTIKINNWEDLDKVSEFLYSKNNKYKCVIVDSISEINWLCEQGVVSKVSMQRYAKGVPALGDYGISAVYMRKAIRVFRDLAEDKGISAIISASEQREKDEGSGVVTLMPNLTGKLAREVQGILDAVGYMRINKRGNREIIFKPESNRDAKDRFEGCKLGEYIENPTVNDIIEKIKEE